MEYLLLSHIGVPKLDQGAAGSMENTLEWSSASDFNDNTPTETTKETWAY